MGAISSKAAKDPWAWIKAVNDIIVDGPWDPQNGSLPVELAEWLWLSDQRSVENTGALQRLGITHVLSTNFMLRYEKERLKRILGSDFEHCVVEGVDDPDYDMIGKHWDSCRRFLAQAKEAGGRVVIHCSSGTNRSAAICAAAMLCLQEDNLLPVVRKLKRQRGMVLTNISFQRQLCLLAAKEGKLGRIPRGYPNRPIPDGSLVRPTNRYSYVSSRAGG